MIPWRYVPDLVSYFNDGDDTVNSPTYVEETDRDDQDSDLGPFRTLTDDEASAP